MKVQVWVGCEATGFMLRYWVGVDVKALGWVGGEGMRLAVT